MQIVKPEVSLVWITPNAAQMIELAGRTAYKSEDKITATSADEFVRMLLKRGHEAVIEHASASLRVICDRGVTHEFVRHRLFSYTQESTRYCNYGKAKFGNEITVIHPPGLTERQTMHWEAAMKSAERAYLNMIEDGASPQLARSVLPTCLKTEIVCTANFREWRHFFRLRRAPVAHPQMREIADKAFAILTAECPVCFLDLIEEPK